MHCLGTRARGVATALREALGFGLGLGGLGARHDARIVHSAPELFGLCDALCGVKAQPGLARPRAQLRDRPVVPTRPRPRDRARVRLIDEWSRVRHLRHGALAARS